MYEFDHDSDHYLTRLVKQILIMLISRVISNNIHHLI